MALAVYGQKPKFALHVYNPIALFQKAGAKIEYRTTRMGFLLTGIQYYGSFPQYRGTQGGVECRGYFYVGSKDQEYFLSSRAFVGQQQYVPQSGDGFFNLAEIPAGNYYGFGLATGRHFNFGHFFLDINGGLKFTKSSVEQDRAFYITGPASILDLHFNLGMQF